MGTLWAKSGDIARDNSDNRAIGALAYFFVGGTTTPLPVYQDAGESTPHEDPVEADGNGRWPAVFVPFCTSFDVKITTSGGTQLFYPTEIPNPDPVEAAADTADPEELLATGHIHFELLNTTKAGFVRLNGRTLGDASSGATERANADTEALFAYLWNNLDNSQAAVSGGARGVNAATDYGNHRTITLPSFRGAFPLGLDDMGNTAASLLGSAPFTNGNATTPGSLLGENTHALSAAEHAAHTHSFSATTGAGSAHSHTGTTDTTGSGHQHAQNTSTVYVTGGNNVASGSNINHNAAALNTQTTDGTHTHTFTSATESAHTHSVSGTSGSQGSGTAHNIISRSLLGTWFIKL